MSIRRWPWHWLAPALLGVALYALTIRGVFVYDDLWSCQGDERLHDPSHWSQYLTQGYMPDAADNLWRPLVSLSYAVQAWGNGDHPWAFHLVNIFLHAIACVMVAKLAMRLCGKSIGLVAGLLFAAHPVHVEAVAEIVGRAEELALIGVMGALLLFISIPLTTRRVWGIVACFLFAAFSKEQGLLLPLFLLVWHWLGKWRSEPTVDRDRTSFNQRPRKLLFALLTFTMAAYVAYRNHVVPWFWDRSFLDPAMNPLVQSTGIHRWLIPVAVMGRYAMLLVAPYRLSIDYGMNVFTPRLNWSEPWFYLGLLAILVWVVALVIACKRRNRAGAFCLIAFAASYGMIGNFIIIGTIMGDRLMYLPSAFFCILIAMILPRPTTPRGAALLTILLVLASLRTVTYAWEWNSRLKLYSYAVATQPKASMPYLLLAGELDYPHADALLARARQEAPDAPQVWSKSAWCKIGLGQLDAADKFAHHAFQLRPGSAESLGAIARIQELRAAAATQATPSSP